MNVLVFGHRNWSNPDAIYTALFMTQRLHGDFHLWEGCATGADIAGHKWGFTWLPEENHHHFAVDWAKARAERPDWWLAGNERNQVMLGEMLQHGQEHTFLGFHENLDPAKGGTSDMATRILLSGHRVWLVHGGDPVEDGRWLDAGWLKNVPPRRLALIKASMNSGGSR